MIRFFMIMMSCAVLLGAPQGRKRPAAVGAAMEENINRHGADYRDFDVRAGGPRVCQEACLKDGQCRAWTYVKPGEHGDLARCYLKNEVPEATGNDCCTSGVKRQAGAPPAGQSPGMSAGVLERNVDRPGSDYRDMDLSTPDPKACQAACLGDSQCRAWTYVKPGEHGDKARCYLKNEVPPPAENECCVSGVKGRPAMERVVLRPGGTAGTMEHNMDRHGSDYRDFDLSLAEPRACQAACLQDGRCRAWTYIKPGEHGDKARCYLKDAVPEASENECCVSGVKR